MTVLFQPGSIRGVIAPLAVLIFLIIVQNVFAGPCPELPDTLQQKIVDKYPRYSIADYRAISHKNLDKSAQRLSLGCFHLIRLSPSCYAILLMNRQNEEIKLIVAESLVYLNITGWYIYEVDYFENDIPLLEPAKGGMYLDIEKKKNFVITRNCQAFHMKLLHSGWEYVYEFLGKGNVKKIRIK